MLERAVKRKVTAYLLELQHKGAPCWFRMHVPSGYGKASMGLDYEGCLSGYYFAIETKAPGEQLRPLQRATARKMIEAGGRVFVVSSDDGLNAFKHWVEQCKPT